ncbi:MAG: DNA-3-methyladenine glycosylase 2 family protein [Proteobacteria bacterium]|nr:DNA-3-methyladenine glycosylase 2 family protein [Pseudomonadota bacterium]
MNLSREICLRAMKSKDAKFDGRFFIGVHSTGIYCRPICPAPSPKPKNIRFYPSAAAAADAGLRPCLRCRPEIAPGIDWSEAPITIVQALTLISDTFPDQIKTEDLAERLDVSDRHLRRLFQRNLGTTPFSIWNTKKIHFAKRLIDETSLTMTEIAFASGFNSIRSFNDTFKKTYGKPPLELRKNQSNEKTDQTITLHLAYREPFNWQALLEFLDVRSIPGVEHVFNGCYQRVIRIGDSFGMILVSREKPGKSRPALKINIAFPESDKLYHICEKIKKMFDLDAPITEIDRFLKSSTLLKPSVIKDKGLRVPGCWDPFELCIRAIIGQQISVKGATTISGRIVERYGKVYNGPVPSGEPRKWYIFPEPSVLKDVGFDGLGLTRTRIDTIKSLSASVDNEEIVFDPNTDVDAITEKLRAIKGIGDWTAQYIAMRALRDPNAFPSSDLGLVKAASTTDRKIKPKDLETLSQNWTPWRANAAMYLWRSL